MSEVTIYTLAKALNMSPSAVSRAFNPKGRVSAEKRARVLAEAERLGYTPNKHASRLSMRTVKIGVVINSDFEPQVNELKLGAQIAHKDLRDYKVLYDLTVVTPKTTDLSEYDGILSRYEDFDGVIITGMGRSKYSDFINRLYKKNPNIALVQSQNDGADYLFASKHDERYASRLAADFLNCCICKSSEKSILLFTGDAESALHAAAREEFVNYCERLGMRLLSSVDMHDDEEYFEKILPSVFEGTDSLPDAIYITSGFSAPLCRYLEKRGLKIPLVAFDNYGTAREYIKKGIIFASVAQNAAGQMQTAFSELVKYIVTGEAPRRTVYTDIRLCFRSDMEKE
jgi:DNA-binding LacI/PurR family transcriptional regulator